MNPLAIKIENLTKVYKSGGRETRALDNLNLEVPVNQIYGFLGPNAAGKTTTIKLLLDLIAPTSGRTWVFCRKTLIFMMTFLRKSFLISLAKYFVFPEETGLTKLSNFSLWLVLPKRGNKSCVTFLEECYSASVLLRR